MNIAVFSHYFTPEIGAPPARIFDLSQEWIKQGHQVQVATCFPNHPVGKIYEGYSGGRFLHEKLSGIDVYRSWTYITPNKGFFRKSLGHLSLWPSARLLSVPRMTRPSVAIGTSPTFFAAMAAQGAARRFRVPYIMEVRDLWPACFVDLGVIKSPLLIKLLEKWELKLYAQADRIVTVTETFRDNLISRGVPAPKIRAITNGADESFWSPLGAKARLKEKLGLPGFNVLYLGAHGISQRLSAIIAGARLLQKNGSIQFLFVGEGAEKEALQRQAAEEGLKNIRFFDSVKKEGVREFYEAADVCLVPLRDIPLFRTFIPSKMFEIMAMGRPIVASLAGEAEEILRRSGGALIVPPENSQAIADAILKLHRDPSLGEALGAAGRCFVIQNYSRHASARKYLEVIEDARDQSGKRMHGSL